MRILSSRKGFSLVELLTVIAIIAILAAIIFPVMSMVKERARKNDCMTKLHQIAMGIEMYKKDNRKYPSVLVPVQFINGVPVTIGDAKGDGLFPEYVKTARMFHCPSSKVTSKTDIAGYPSRWYDNTSPDVWVYAYNSYDSFVKGNPSDGIYASVEQHYAIDWADTLNRVTQLPPYGGGGGLTDQRDYERQLKFRTPPADTVVTWCSYHEHRTGDGITGQVPVVFLDGHAASYNAAEVEASRWRTRQKD